jgi:hypothetical protein
LIGWLRRFCRRSATDFWEILIAAARKSSAHPATRGILVNEEAMSGMHTSIGFFILQRKQ